MNNEVILAFLLTMFAGLATVVGGMLPFFVRNMNKRFFSFSLGLSSGVMIFISLTDLFPEARKYLSNSLGDSEGYLATISSFFVGIIIISVIDKITDKKLNINNEYAVDANLKRIGIVTAIALAVQNFPEGIVTFMSTLQNPSAGVAISIATFIHNIPEGIAVAIPVYYVTGKKSKAFLWTLFSGLVEPFGALLTYLILMPFLNDVTLGLVLAVASGIMLYVAISELQPTAQKYDGVVSNYGFVSGLAIMAFSLFLLGA